jgi:hypothetical protein
LTLRAWDLASLGIDCKLLAVSLRSPFGVCGLIKEKEIFMKTLRDRYFNN